MKRTLSLAAAVAAAFALPGCGLSGPQSTLNPVGPLAERQMQVFMVTLWVAVGIFAVVGTLFAYCLARFTVKGDPPADAPLPDQGHGNTLLEIGLILTSICLVGIIAVPTLGGIFYQGTLPADEKNVLVVKVTGLQWWWKFEYPSLGVVTANEVALPQGKPVKFELHTADVIHSFWIPRLGGKVDVMPNQNNWLWLQGDVPGVYYGQCAEFCGESHAFMRFRARVMDQMSFDEWVANQKAEASSAAASMAGAQAFKESKCAVCHTIRGHGPAGIIGPDLTHVASRESLAAGIFDNTQDGTINSPQDDAKLKENLKAWISNPESHKPGNLMYKAGYKAMKIELQQSTIDDLAAYLSSLK